MALREVTHLQIAGIWIDCSISETHGLQAEVTRHPVEDGADVTDNVRLMPDTIGIEGLVTNQPIEVPQSHANSARGSESGAQLTTPDGSAITQVREAGSQSTTIYGEPTAGFLGLVPGLGQVNALLGLAGRDLLPRRQYQMITPDLAARNVAWQANALRFDKSFDRVRAVHDALRATFEARAPVQVVTGLRVYESVVLVDLQISRDGASAGSLRFGATGQVIRIVKSQTGIAGKPDPVQTRATPAISKGNQNTAEVKPTEVPPRQRSAILGITDKVKGLFGGGG